MTMTKISAATQSQRPGAVTRTLLSVLLLGTLSAGAAAQDSEYRSRMRAGTAPLAGADPDSQRWIVMFKKRFDLRTLRAANIAGRTGEAKRLVANFERRVVAEQGDFVRTLQELGGTVTGQFWIINAASIDIHPKHLPTVAAMPSVLRLDPDVVVQHARLRARRDSSTRAMLPIQKSTDSLNHNSDAVNSNFRGNGIDYKGMGVAIAVLGSGLDSKYQGTAIPHKNYFVDGNLNLRNRLVVAWKPTLYPTADATTAHSVGVASVAAGASWNGPVDSGHAPLADLASYHMGNFSLAEILAAWTQVLADRSQFGISIANYSNSGDSDPLAPVQQIMDQVARTGDILVVAAAGNKCQSTYFSPSCANGLAVGAVDPVDSANPVTSGYHVASFSSRGPMAGDTDRFYPDIAACGVATTMTMRDSETAAYTEEGTSFAAPQVSGAGALIRAAVSMRAEQAKAILLASSKDVSGQNGAHPYNSRNAYGMGFLRDDDAMDIALATGNHGIVTLANTTPPPVWIKLMNVVKDKPYAVAISWMRHTMTDTNWSNLKLEILDGATVIASADTPRNLYEMVRFEASKTGQYQIRVTANSFQGTADQDFGFAFTQLPFGRASYTTYGTGLPGACEGTGDPTHPHGVVQPSVVSNVLLKNDHGGVSTNLPMDGTSVYQQMFLHSELPSVATEFRGVAFRAGANTVFSPAYLQNLEIKIGYTAKTLAQMDLTFANNFDSQAQGVVPADKLTVKTVATAVLVPSVSGCVRDAKDFYFEIIFDTNFTWVPPAPGTPYNLVFKLKNTSATGGVNYWDAVDTALDKKTRRAWKTSIGPKADFQDYTGLVMKFLEKVPSTSFTKPLLRNDGKPTIGRNFRVNLSQAAKNATYFMYTGASNTAWSGGALPFDMTTWGAPGCFILTSLEYLQATGLTTTTGNASVQIPIPANPALIGGWFFNQFFVADPNANTFGIVTTNGGEARIGGF